MATKDGEKGRRNGHLEEDEAAGAETRGAPEPQRRADATANAQTLELSSNQKGERFDRAIASALSERGLIVSVHEVRRALLEGKIRIEGKKIKPGVRALGGERIDLGDFRAKSKARASASPELIARVPILYEDERVLALLKPSGMPTAPLSADERETLVGAALAIAPVLESVGPPLESGLLHRLDTATSGVVLFAKTEAAREELREAFRENRVQKHYLALVFDPLRELEKAQWIDQPVTAESHGKRVYVAKEGEKSLPAQTRVEPRLALRGSLRLVDVFPTTGRRHQIRVHLAFVGAPIIGDELYGSPSAPKADRLALHAYAISAPGVPRIVAPVPDDLRKILLRFDCSPAEIELG